MSFEMFFKTFNYLITDVIIYQTIAKPLQHHCNTIATPLQIIDFDNNCTQNESFCTQNT